HGTAQRHGGRARPARPLDQEVRRADRGRQLPKVAEGLNVACAGGEAQGHRAGDQGPVGVTRSGAPFLLEFMVNTTSRAARWWAVAREVGEYGPQVDPRR